MPIKIKHAPSAAAIGESAYTIGTEEKRRWAADIAMRQRALNLQAYGMELGAKGSAEQLAHQEAELAFRKKQDIAGRETAERRWEEEPSRQLQKSLESQQRLQENVVYEYSQAQKVERARIIEGLGWIDAEVIAKRLLPEQGEKLAGQMWAKYYGIHPYPVDKEPGPQEMFDGGIVKHPTTGAEYWMNPKTGNPEPLGSSYKDSANFFIEVAKLFTSEDDITGVKTVDWDGVDEFVRNAEGRIAQRQGLAARAEEIQAKQQQAEERIAGEEEQEQQEAKIQAAVEALPTLFNTLIKGQPKIGRVKKGKPSSDKVYGEEAYNKTLIEAVGRGEQEGIPPDIMKAELDKWWDAQYDKERGQMFQKFGNRMEFEGAEKGAERPGTGITARKVASEEPAERKVAPEPQSMEEFIEVIKSMDDKAKAKAYYDKWVGKWQ